MSITAIIQARMTSTRLPGKILKQVMGKPLLEFMIERVRESRSITDIIIATTTNPEDDPVVELASRMSVQVFRGSEQNVLERFYQAAEKYGDDIIMRLTGDCPLIDPELLDQLVEFFIQGQYDYASNCLEPTLPDGLDAEIFTFKSLKEACDHAKLPSELEHVTPYIRNQENHFKIGSWKYSEDLSGMRWTVDEPEDFDLVKEIISSLYPQKSSFRLHDILQLFKKRPELQQINKKFDRNEGLRKSLVEDKKVLLYPEQ